MRNRLARLFRRWIPVVRQSLPLPLPARHILLPPTGMGLFYTALVLVMILGALNYANNPALLLALLLGAAGVISLLTAQRQLTGVTLLRLQVDPVPAGQLLTMTLAISTTDKRSRNGLTLTADEHPPVPVHWQADGHGEARLCLPSERRGQYMLPPLTIASHWPLGLVKVSLRFQLPDTYVIHPAAEAGAPPLPAIHLSTGNQQHPDADPSDLRAHRHGDSLSRIAWKTSARRGSLITRHATASDATVHHLHWQDLSHLPYEQRISRLAHWIQQAEHQQDHWVLHLPHQPPIGPDQGPAHLRQCLNALALLPNQPQ